MTRQAAEIRLEHDNRAFVPGERLRGTAAWQAAEAPRAAEVRLFFHTEGQGERDVVVVATQEFEAPGAMESRTFSFVMPEGPLSFQGNLFSLVWSLELEIRGPGLVARVDLVLSPTGEILDLRRHAPA